MRKCTARAWVKAVAPEKIGKWIDVLGVFHQFGTMLGPEGTSSYTIAIVEDIEGQVWECPVDSLRFLRVSLTGKDKK